MSLIGAILNAAPTKTPVPMVGRSQGGLFGAFTRQAGTTQQLSAMEASGTVFNIVDRIATAVSLVNWQLWRKSKSGKAEDRTEITSHLALDVWNKPNDFYTRQELVEVEQQHQELTGEGWTVVGYDPRARKIPLELWPVRPDRMEPVPSAEAYLKGYTYRSFDGEMVPLERKDVLFMRRPDPNNPYRGLGPIKPILVDIDSSRAAAEWNRSFFANSAEPGGIVEVEKRLSDDEFDELTRRWAEQHQGVSRAHSVAILENGVKWVDRKYTMRDMEFTELRGVTASALREAFGFPKFMAGLVDDVNRANAEASEAMFAQWLVVPRLERWKAMLNFEFLPLFGATADGLEFDYIDPVPENSEAENTARTSKVGAVASLVPLGFDAKESLKAFGLPDIPWTKPEPPPMPPGAGFPPGQKPQPGKERNPLEALFGAPVLDHKPGGIDHDQSRHGRRYPGGRKAFEQAQELEGLRESLSQVERRAVETPRAAPSTFAQPTASPTRMTKSQYTKLLKDEHVRLQKLDGKSDKEARALARPAATIDDLKERNRSLRAQLRNKGVDHRTDEQRSTDDTEKTHLLDEVQRLAVAVGHDGAAKRAGAARMTTPELRKFIKDVKQFQARQAGKTQATQQGREAEAEFRRRQATSPATDRQVDFIMNLLSRRRRSGEAGGFMTGPTDHAGVAKLSRADASMYINSLTGDY